MNFPPFLLCHSEDGNRGKGKTGVRERVAVHARAASESKCSFFQDSENKGMLSARLASRPRTLHPSQTETTVDSPPSSLRSSSLHLSLVPSRLPNEQSW